MILTLRMLLLILLGATLIAGGALDPRFIWLAVAYLLVLLLLMIADFLLTSRPHDLEVERLHDQRLSLGADNTITILVANRSRQKVYVQIRDEYPYSFQSSHTILKGQVAPFELLEARYFLHPYQRGNYAFGDIHLRYTSCLQTFIRQARYPAQVAIKVYPNVLEVRKYDLLARRGLLHELGLRPQRILGSGTEFERLREYSTDDEYRRINWKATARRGKPIAAEYETERSQYVISLIDSGRLMRSPVPSGNPDHQENSPQSLAKLDYAINSALLLSYVALLKGDYVGMLTFADDVRNYLAPRRGKVQFQRMLEALYHVQFEMVEANHAQALAYLGTRHRRRSLVVMYTDLVTLDAARPMIAHMANLSRHHIPLCVMIADPHISQLRHKPLQASQAVYERAVAEMLLDERKAVCDMLNRHGVLTLDVPASQLSVSVINTYLALKGRGAI